MYTQHVPVMLEEVLRFLQPRPGSHYIDGTLGGGGHTAAILERSAPDGRVLGIDADLQALTRVRERLSEYVHNGRLVLVHGNFADLARIANEAGFVSVQGVLLDLGFSSDQMEDPQRGFSFSADGPLDMRLDQSLERSAADLVNAASEQELADIFWRYGEEPRARQIARRIMRERAKGAITRTAQLAALVAAGVPYKPGAIHPATKVFQALRIAVNAELERLEVALPQIVDVLQKKASGEVGGEVGSKVGGEIGMAGTSPATTDIDREAYEVGGEVGGEVSREVGSEVGGEVGMAGTSPATTDIDREAYLPGRMVIISFHSLEDRIVKEFMRREARDCLCPPRVPVCVCGHKARLRLLTTKPVIPTVQEIARNPRARSAKLRAAEIIGEQPRATHSPD